MRKKLIGEEAAVGLFKEFKTFVTRGNVVDLAIGMVSGAAFTAIVTSLVNDLITPLIGRITGGLDVSSTLFLALDGVMYSSLEEIPAEVAVLKFGSFLQAVINFLIIALCLFFVVRSINRLQQPFKKPAEAPAPKPKRKCPYCLNEVADEATRCPHCTSMIEFPEEPDAVESNAENSGV